ncbi:hypothetical protein KIN20_000073 [Parelaphostrongylus tenuis]|uniref:Uncharacterized protein n=1 Tax=Parelaphostrongylus tenuis TaxID=148309 RepID=A0AAD5QDI8_PARTN|nr:hypothetical protein KIN20_000073 [Parelaphostrongylus tenuis]
MTPIKKLWRVICSSDVNVQMALLGTIFKLQLTTSIVQNDAKSWVELRRRNGSQSFTMEILILPINHEPGDRVKLIDKQSLKILGKIRLCQSVIWRMISRCQGSKEEVNRFWLGALGSSTVFVRSVPVRFYLFRSLEHWLDKKKFRDINHLRRE